MHEVPNSVVLLVLVLVTVPMTGDEVVRTPPGIVVNCVTTLLEVHVDANAEIIGVSNPKQVVVVPIAEVVGSAVMTSSTKVVVGNVVVIAVKDVKVANVVHDVVKAMAVHGKPWASEGK